MTLKNRILCVCNDDDSTFRVFTLQNFAFSASEGGILQMKARG